MKELTLKRKIPEYLESLYGVPIKELLIQWNHGDGLFIPEITRMINAVLAENDYGTTITVSSVRRWFQKYDVDTLTADQSEVMRKENERRWKHDSMYRENMLQTLKDSVQHRWDTRREEELERLQKVHKRWYDDEEYRTHMTAILKENSDKVRFDDKINEEHRHRTTELWKDEEFRNKVFANKKFITKNTSIELTVKKWLDDLKILYQQQRRIEHDNGTYFTDFFIEPNMVIEVQGDYWPQIQQFIGMLSR